MHRPPPPTTVHPPGARARLGARTSLTRLCWCVLASLAWAWPAHSSEVRGDDAAGAAPAAAPADEPPAVR